MSYPPIEDHGIIGDLHTAAIVGADGSIDWRCLPYFDSPSVFASIPDDKKGGYFKIGAVGEEVTPQQYHPDTNVLMTYFSSSEGVVLLEDFTPVSGLLDRRDQPHMPKIVRRVTGGARRQAHAAGVLSRL